VHGELRGEAALVEPERTALDALAAGAEPVAEVRDRPRPEGDVDERIALEDPLPLGLGVAAADGDDPCGVGVLERLRVAEVRGEPRVGQVLKTRTSASSGAVASPRPRSSSRPLIRSESCAFIWQPNVVTW
jgi:hypothetical protein